jgi:hypothetical protein
MVGMLIAHSNDTISPVICFLSRLERQVKYLAYWGQSLDGERKLSLLDESDVTH